MFCPTCGKEAETTIAFQGAKVCPHCGCVIEYEHSAIKKRAKKFLKKKEWCAIAFLLLSIVLSVFCCISYYIPSRSNLKRLLPYYTPARCRTTQINLFFIVAVLTVIICVAISIAMIKNNNKAIIILSSCYGLCCVVYTVVVDIIFCSWYQVHINGKQIIYYLVLICLFVILLIYLIGAKNIVSIITIALAVVYGIYAIYLAQPVIKSYTQFDAQFAKYMISRIPEYGGINEIEEYIFLPSMVILIVFALLLIGSGRTIENAKNHIEEEGE